MMCDHVLCLDCVLRWIALRTNKLKCENKLVEKNFGKMVQKKFGQQVKKKKIWTPTPVLDKNTVGFVENWKIIPVFTQEK